MYNFVTMKKQSFADILNGITEADSARVFKKVPAWADVPGIEFPSRLSTEQCSSQATALYKAALAGRIIAEYGEGGGIIDLTGGLGVDCWAFSRVAGRVHHNEMNVELSAAVRKNFDSLGISNASFSSIEVQTGNIPEVIASSGFSPALIFLDPARRSDTGRKVFLLEDCRPDILSLKSGLLEAAPSVLIKLSPMADITMVCRRLGAEVREVHVVGAAGECKELLIWLQRGWEGGYEIVCSDAGSRCGTLRFTPSEEAGAVPAFLPDAGGLEDGWLFEPSAALLKAGCFNLLCSRLGLRKFARFTHLYFTDSPASELSTFGKVFRIDQVHPFDSSTIKSIGKSLGPCEVTARNLPITSDALRKKLGAASGANSHVFAFAADFASGSSRLLLVCSK